MKTNIKLLAAGMFLAALGNAFGQPTFTRITTGPVVTDVANSGGASWVDFDNDGDSIFD